MNRRDWLIAGAAAVLAWRTRAETPATLPALPDDAALWINSAPLGPDALRGRAVLVEFWTFDCYNCRNTQAWMDRVSRTYAAAGLVTVAVHTPEFEHERRDAAVRAAVRARKIGYPVLLDPEYRVWRSFDNAYWPAVYLFDRAHRRVGAEIGELHAGESRADRFEALVRRTLA
jgi:thiol-disulfide isomerase/thioredoxin